MSQLTRRTEESLKKELELYKNNANHGCISNKVFENILEIQKELCSRGLIQNPIQEGYCECGNNDLNYDAIEVQDEGVFYPFDCKKCGKTGTEHYDLNFSEVIMDT